jgi:hypothetical protein
MRDTPVFREYLHFYRTGDPVTLQYLLTFLSFLSKADFDFADLKDTTFRAWLEVELELEQLELDEHLLRLVKASVDVLFDDRHFDDSIFLPKHGSGSTSEKASNLDEKFDHLDLDAKLDWAFRNVRSGRSDRIGLSPRRQWKHLLYDDDGNLKQVDYVFRRSLKSRLEYVPKSYKSYRTICMEPASYMYHQQEVMRWFVGAMEKSRINRFVDLRNQEHNQDGAMYGSYSYGLDTIDLSAASDRVHNQLVRKAFTPKVLKYLLGTRSSIVQYTTPEGVKCERELVKFAPMGSALCFPVQCVLFSSIALISYSSWHHPEILSGEGELKSSAELRRTFSEALKMMSNHYEYDDKRLHPFRVFGDDILCDSRITSTIEHLLERLGLVVNKQKSFVGGQSVRESCGIYAYEGNDITPIRFRIKRGQGIQNPEVLMSWFAEINKVGDAGFRRLHSHLINRLASQVDNDLPRIVDYRTYTNLYQNSVSGRDLLPFSDDRNTSGIWSAKPQKPRCSRPMPDKGDGSQWQIDEELVIGVEVRNRRGNVPESYLYDQWMRSKIHGGSNEPFRGSSPRVLPRHLRTSLGWTPVRR